MSELTRTPIDKRSRTIKKRPVRAAIADPRTIGVKISQLPLRTTIAGTDEVTTLAGGVNYRSPLSAVTGVLQSFTELDTTAVAANVSVIQTLGYAAAGDGGEATYKRVTTPPTPLPYPGFVQSADGAWWEHNDFELNVRAFGAKGDAIADDRPAIQNAIDRAIGLQYAGKGPRKVLLAPGMYKITQPLHIWKWTPGSPGAFAYCTVTLGSDAYGYASSRRTELLPTFKDLPAIICQTVRSVNIYGFAIAGKANSVFPSYKQLLYDDDPNPWWSSDLVGGVLVNTGARDNGYSPHAGIVTDPFRNTVPVDDRYPGYDEYYAFASSAASRNLIIDKMQIDKFIVGVGLSIGLHQLGDNISVTNCGFIQCKVCIVNGQSQNRMNLFHNNFGQACQVFVDSGRYGGGVAPMGIISGGGVVFCKWVIHASPGGESAAIRDFYAEAIWSIGFWGYTGGGHSLLLERCHFKLLDCMDTDGSPIVAIDTHFQCMAPATFYGGYIGFNTNYVRRFSLYNAGNVLFDGNIMLDGVPQCAIETNAIFKSVRVRFDQGGPQYGISQEYNGTSLTTVATGGRVHAPPGCVVNDISLNRRWRAFGAWDAAVVQASAVTVTVPGDPAKMPPVRAPGSSQPWFSPTIGTATFTCNPISNAAYIQVGDELVTQTVWYGESPMGGPTSMSYAKQIIGRVYSVDYTTGDVVLVRVPKSFCAGANPTSIANIYQYRLPLIHPITVATTTAGSKVLTNIDPAVSTQVSLWAFWTAFPEAPAWASGTAYSQFAMVNVSSSTYTCTVAHTAAAATQPGVGASWATVWGPPLKQGERINGTGIPAQTRVVSFDATANTITISHAPTNSLVTEIYDAKLVLEEGSATLAPTTGVWSKGTFLKNSGIAAKDASNMVLRGWVCTVSGAPGTWEPQYTSAVSPAT